MSNKNLFKEAIADAKAVREAALANAKAALEEALTPKLQSMLAAKLNEMDSYEEGMYEEEIEVEEGFNTEEFGFDAEDTLEEEFDLSEILAELDEEKISEPFTDKEPHMDIKGTERGYVKEAKKEEEEETETETETEENSVADMSVEDLKSLIQDLITQEMGNEGGMEMHDEPDADNAGGPSDHDADNAGDEIDLEELLAELDALGESDDDIMEARRRKSKHEKGETKAQEKAEHASGKEKAEKAEMREAIATINTLRSELNEVNLLNAKLLYVNKIFKAKNLSESQKLQVIASFDKATTAKEAKVVYESLNATLTPSTAKKQIKESMGFASKAAGTAPRNTIVESNDIITRMQKLANIIK